MILVTGAAGPTGLSVIAALAARGQAVRALAHRAEQREALLAAGAREVLLGDMIDAAAMREALGGVRALYHIPPGARPPEALVLMGDTLLQAAGEVGVALFVFHSVLHPQIEGLPHHRPKLLFEGRLLDSGLPFTVLQPTSYLQNWTGRLGEEALYVPWGVEARLTMVDLEEVAEVAARVLTEPGHLNATYELCGGDVTVGEIAREMSVVLGKQVRAQQIPVAAWQEMLQKFGRSAGEAALLGQMAQYYDSGRFRGNPQVLSWLLGRPPRTLAEVLRRRR